MPVLKIWVHSIRQQGNASTRDAHYIGPSLDIESVLSYQIVHHDPYQKAICFKSLGLPNPLYLTIYSMLICGSDCMYMIHPVCVQCPKYSLPVCQVSPNVSELSVIVPTQRLLGHGSHGGIRFETSRSASSSQNRNVGRWRFFPILIDRRSR